MKRTQIYLDDEIFSFVKKEGEVENRSISDIIRESVREKIMFKNCEIVKKMESVFGMWRDRNINVRSYMRAVRRDRRLW